MPLFPKVPAKTHRRPVLPVLLALCLCLAAAPTPHAATAPEDQADLRFIGVFEVGNSARALVRLAGLEGEFLVSEGDLLGGYTLENVQRNRLLLRRDQTTLEIALEGERLLKPDLNIKTYSSAYAGENDFHPTSTKLLTRGKPRPESLSSRLASLSSNHDRPKFLRPMRTGWVSSGFGPRRRPRASGGYGSRNHKGIDIAAPHGSSVYATADGIVTQRGYDPYGKGRYLVLKHSSGYESRYYHLHNRYVHEGDRVQRGQRIASEGNTGRSTGPHLHFEIRKNGVPLDPALFIPSLKD